MLPLQKYTAVKREKINRKIERKKWKRETELKSRRKDVGPWRGKGEKPRGVHVSRKRTRIEDNLPCRPSGRLSRQTPPTWRQQKIIKKKTKQNKKKTLRTTHKPYGPCSFCAHIDASAGKITASWKRKICSSTSLDNRIMKGNSRTEKKILFYFFYFFFTFLSLPPRFVLFQFFP